MKVKTLSLILGLTGMFLICGSNYISAGSLLYQASQEVEEGFEGGGIVNEFNVYFSGSRAEPHTIIGVAKSVPFNQSLWQQAASTPRTVQKWCELIDNPHRSIRDQYFGGYIISGTDEKIGVWYSRYRFVGATLSEEGVLSIARPHKKDKVSGVKRQKK